ncbi:hypothetical protein [Sphaerothrix gracilis]|uniref:hypothetical protein n=1 Tax=Sphaerothrix gracilis TaxID=3151835 RepID=UPI0031FBDCD7
MKLLGFNFSKKVVRVCLSFAIAAVLMLSYVSPAAALGGRQSAPNEGVDQLQGVQEKSEQALKREPRSREDVQSDAAQGTNEIQGAADAEKMYRPENSQASESIEQRVEEALSDVTP